MTMLNYIFQRIGNLRLKWKILLPFLFFAVVGTGSLSYIGLTSQQKIIKNEEINKMEHFYSLFLEEMNHKMEEALSLATMTSENPDVQELLAQRDRKGLNDLLFHTYIKMRMYFDIEQFHFHIPPGISFLRLHEPAKFGDDLSSYRKTITDAMVYLDGRAGLEKGKSGFGIRGVAPVFYDSEVVGTVEIGLSFGEAFLQGFYERWGVDILLYEVLNDKSYHFMSKAGKMKIESIFTDKKDFNLESLTMIIEPYDYALTSVLVGPIKNYSGETVALVEMIFDRADTKRRLDQTRNLMVIVGLIGITISSILTLLVAILIVRPIREIVNQAQGIAEERIESRLPSRPMDEIGELTEALNTMLDALKERRVEIENYAANLERIIRERTADLLASEEKYRTLVENVPLIVYRLRKDGTTEFINSYLTEILGYSIEEAVGDRDFWREKIYGEDQDDQKNPFTVCFNEGKELWVERDIRHKEGNILTFIDHAIPVIDAEGEIQWVEGIMIDISQIKKLQEMALRTEEIRTLGEISARVAHEIRNPLVTTGGFSRRLYDSLPENDPNRKLAKVIVEEVSRLESFLKILLNSIKPFELVISEVDMHALLRSVLEKVDNYIKKRNIKVNLQVSPSIHKVQGDEEMLYHAFESILKHAIVSIPNGEALDISTDESNGALIIKLRHKLYHLSEEDIEQFFFPHIEEDPEMTIEDLPISKIIIHRHGGKVDLERNDDNVLTMKIELRYSI